MAEVTGGSGIHPIHKIGEEAEAIPKTGEGAAPPVDARVGEVATPKIIPGADPAVAGETIAAPYSAAAGGAGAPAAPVDHAIAGVQKDLGKVAVNPFLEKIRDPRYFLDMNLREFDNYTESNATPPTVTLKGDNPGTYLLAVKDESGGFQYHEVQITDSGLKIANKETVYPDVASLAKSVRQPPAVPVKPPPIMSILTAWTQRPVSSADPQSINMLAHLKERGKELTNEEIILSRNNFAYMTSRGSSTAQKVQAELNALASARPLAAASEKLNHIGAMATYFDEHQQLRMAMRMPDGIKTFSISYDENRFYLENSEGTVLFGPCGYLDEIENSAISIKILRDDILARIDQCDTPEKAQELLQLLDKLGPYSGVGAIDMAVRVLIEEIAAKVSGLVAEKPMLKPVLELMQDKIETDKMWGELMGYNREIFQKLYAGTIPTIREHSGRSGILYEGPLSDKDRFRGNALVAETAVQPPPGVQQGFINSLKKGPNDTWDKHTYIVAQAPESEAAAAAFLHSCGPNALIMNLTTASDRSKHTMFEYFPKENGQTIQVQGLILTGRPAIDIPTDDPGKKARLYECTMYNPVTKETTVLRMLIATSDWPDHGVVPPDELDRNVTVYNALCDKLGIANRAVHCRAGYGRTGAFVDACVMDNMITDKAIVSADQARGATADLVKKGRRDRGPAWVQVPEQLELLIRYQRRRAGRMTPV